MPGLTLQTSGFVLQKSPATDRFQPVLLFSSEHGNLHCYLRISSRQPLAQVDLFDELDASLTSSNQGRTWFFAEVRLRRRFAGIGLSFAALQEASAFTALLVRNLVHVESRAAAHALLGNALQAWSEGARPDIVAVKALYSFARTEGYPVKEDWAAGLRGTDQDCARALLNLPVQSAVATDPEAAARVLDSLRRFVRTRTEILLPDEPA